MYLLRVSSSVGMIITKDFVKKLSIQRENRVLSLRHVAMTISHRNWFC